MRFFGVVFSSNCPSWSYKTICLMPFILEKIFNELFKFWKMQFSGVWDTGEMQLSGVWDTCELQNAGVWDTGESGIAGKSWVYQVRKNARCPERRWRSNCRYLGHRWIMICRCPRHRQNDFLLFPIFHKLKAIATTYKATVSQKTVQI